MNDAREAAYGAIALTPETARGLPRAAFADVSVFEAEVERVVRIAATAEPI